MRISSQATNDMLRYGAAFGLTPKGRLRLSGITAIVRSIIVMGRNLGLEVIAEGVETTAQADFLKAEGCHELQGYLFSKPLPAEAFEQVLQSRASVDSKRIQGGRRVERAGG